VSAQRILVHAERCSYAALRLKACFAALQQTQLLHKHMHLHLHLLLLLLCNADVSKPPVG
jgi:hypothetical protein